MNEPSPLADFFGTLTEFLKDLNLFFPEKSESTSKSIQDWKEWESERQTIFIRTVVGNLKKHSRSILLGDDTMFNNPIMIFGIDLSMLWNNPETNDNTKKALLMYMEQLYVYGSLYLRPDQKAAFLKLIRSLKQTRIDLENLNRMNTPNDAPQDPVDNNVNEAIEKVNEMFGFQSGDFMSEMINDIAMKVNDVMQDNDDPSAIFRSLLGGDVSMFNDVMENSSKKMQQKIDSGELDEDALQAQAEKMMGQFQGFMPPGIDPSGADGVIPEGVPIPDGMFGGLPQPSRQPPSDSNKKKKKRKKKRKKKPKTKPSE